MTRLLVVTAVTAEADAIRAAAPPTVTVEPVGVGPAAAAAGTARLLAQTPYDAVICAGIAGGFTKAPIGATVIGVRSIAADLGAESPNAFIPIEDLGFGTSQLHADESLVKALQTALPEALTGDILTLATVTGTQQTADALAARYPHALAEAMEGFGAAEAARQAGIPYAEIRTISNRIGPRDRDAWRLGEALAALTKAAAKLPA